MAELIGYIEYGDWDSALESTELLVRVLLKGDKEDYHIVTTGAPRSYALFKGVPNVEDVMKVVELVFGGEKDCIAECLERKQGYNEFLAEHAKAWLEDMDDLSNFDTPEWVGGPNEQAC